MLDSGYRRNLLMRSVSDSQKRAVLTRDSFKCRYCGTSLSYPSAHMDHAIPRSRGGLTIMDNLRSSCEPCNLGKGTKTESEYIIEKIVEERLHRDRVFGALGEILGR